MQHRITAARYDEPTGKWNLTVKRPKKGGDVRNGDVPKKLNKESYEDWEEFSDTTDVLFLGVGGLSRWVWPDIPGLESFSGQVLHSAQWNRNDGLTWEDTVADWGDKRVGVIGVVSYTVTQCVKRWWPHSVLRALQQFRSSLLCSPR